MNNWKLVAGVIGGSLVIVILMSVGLSKMSTDSAKPVKLEGVGGDGRLVKGNKDGKVVVTEFSDFQCPACLNAQPTVEALLKKYPEVKLVYREFPLNEIHPNANPAALAAEAANAQGKFVEFHDWLFSNRIWVDKADPTADFVAAAEALKMDKAKFEMDLKNKTYQSQVDGDISQGLGFGVNSTPTFYVDGYKTNTVDLDAAVKKAIGG